MCLHLCSFSRVFVCAFVFLAIAHIWNPSACELSSLFFGMIVHSNTHVFMYKCAFPCMLIRKHIMHVVVVSMWKAKCQFNTQHNQKKIPNSFRWIECRRSTLCEFEVVANKQINKQGRKNNHYYYWLNIYWTSQNILFFHPRCLVLSLCLSLCVCVRVYVCLRAIFPFLYGMCEYECKCMFIFCVWNVHNGILYMRLPYSRINFWHNARKIDFHDGFNFVTSLLVYLILLFALIYILFFRSLFFSRKLKCQCWCRRCRMLGGEMVHIPLQYRHCRWWWWRWW